MSQRATNADGIRQLLDCAIESGLLDERREHTRRESSLRVAAFPVDHAGNVIGPIVVGRCIDISERGLRVAFLRPTEALYLQIEPMQDGTPKRVASATMKVLRRSIEGRSYISAGSFVQLPETG